MSKVKASSDLKQNTPISGTVEVAQDSTQEILNNIDLYLQYIRQELKQIILDDDLHYSDPMEKKKIYPDFTYIQFCYLLGRLYDRVFSVNTELLYSSYKDHYNKTYDIHKVELCYKVYCKLCGYYGYICSTEQFETMTGVDDGTLKEWLSSGRSNLVNIMLKNAQKSVVSSFENSKLPLLRLAAGNYKYQLDKPLQEREQQAAVDVLPDLLAITEGKKALPDS